MGSSAEREIRGTLVNWFHENEPRARVVHELNVAGQGSNRADLGIVFPDTLFLVEIKSEKDSLKRLKDQFEAFMKCSHGVIVAAHDCHFEGSDLRGCDWMRWSHKDHVWRYPGAEKWDLHRYKAYIEPHAVMFLEMLWASELHDEMARHNIMAGGAQRWQMIHAMSLGMTGKQIREAVCRQLRQRTFAEADPPIVERLAA